MDLLRRTLRGVEAKVGPKKVTQRSKIHDYLDKQVVDSKVMLVPRRYEAPSSPVPVRTEICSQELNARKRSIPLHTGDVSGHEENPRIFTRSAVYLQFSYVHFFTSGSHSLLLPRRPPSA